LKRAQRLINREVCYIGFIQNIREIHPGMGLRKMYNQFEPEDIGRDAFIALGLQAGFRLKAVTNPARTTFSIKSNRYPSLLEGKRFTDVNQVWTSDITYFRFSTQNSAQNSAQGNTQNGLPFSRFYYIVLIMDVYSRRIIGYSLADNMRAENNIKALRMALQLRGIENYEGKLIHHSDRGSQYISNDYTNLLEDYGIQISMCSNVLENAHIERANGTIKNEYLHRWSIQSVYQLKQRVKQAVKSYNNRLHNSIGKTPIEFEKFIQQIPKNERRVLELFIYNKYNFFDENKNQLVLNF
jgi:putative transposase